MQFYVFYWLIFWWTIALIVVFAVGAIAYVISSTHEIQEGIRPRVWHLIFPSFLFGYYLAKFLATPLDGKGG